MSIAERLPEGLAPADINERASPPLARKLSFALFIAVLAFAPFPLGSNRPWSWSLLALLIAACWLWWSLSVWPRPETIGRLARGLAGPLALAGLALLWTLVQLLPLGLPVWTHGVWQAAAGALGKTVDGAVSLAPWRTASELMKLGTYAMAAFLARAFAQRSSDASRLLTWLIAIGAFYCLYGFVLALIGHPQFELFYGIRAVRDIRDLAGPFVNHNSYATYAGLVSLLAGARLINGTWEEVETKPSPLTGLLAAIHYVFGRGAWWLAATILAFSTVIATGSRGGSIATFTAIVAMAGLGTVLAAKTARQKLASTYVLALFGAIAGLFAINGARLLAHVNEMAGSDLAQNMRLMLWDAAWRMVHDAPIAGLGLGTYEVAYPLYAAAIVPFTIDKAHNDYLELLAGWGFPAALCWWAALLWLAFLCARGVLARRRNRIYPMLGLGAVILVGVHAVVDFSLQMPAVALSFAVILGLGVAQAFPTRKDAPSPPAKENAARLPWRLLAIVLPLPALVLIWAALPRLNAGIALEQAFPQSALMAANMALPSPVYAQLDRILARAPADDAETSILRVEAGLGAGRSPETLVPEVQDALSKAPADARGWILLASLLKDRDPLAAGKALSFAYKLAPYAYYLIGPRAAVGAGLWAYLPDNAREGLLRDARLITTDPNRRSDLYTLLARAGGAKLATRALKDDPDSIRKLNQSLARETLHLP